MTTDNDTIRHEMPSREELEARVALGATRLSLAEPDWRTRVQEPIDMLSGDDCVLGQVFGSYTEGLYRLGLTPTLLMLRVPSEWRDACLLPAAIDHGFASGEWLPNEPLTAPDPINDALAALWREEIARA
jgi:hypothetical protein